MEGIKMKIEEEEEDEKNVYVTANIIIMCVLTRKKSLSWTNKLKKFS